MAYYYNSSETPPAIAMSIFNNILNITTQTVIQQHEENDNDYSDNDEEDVSPLADIVTFYMTLTIDSIGVVFNILSIMILIISGMHKSAVGKKRLKFF